QCQERHPRCHRRRAETSRRRAVFRAPRAARPAPDSLQSHGFERSGDVSANEAARPEELQERLGVQFRDPALLEQALTHRSVLRDSAVAGQQSNERLEFLGDAIIGALVARYLYGRLPRATEGELTLLRTWLVRASTLAEWAASLDLGRYLRLGKSDEATTRRTRLL